MMKHIVSIEQCTEQNILRTLNRAAFFEANPNRHLMDRMTGVALFSESSTRTQLSLGAAVSRPDRRAIGFSDLKSSSSTEDESLKDTPLVISNYADVIIMRHYLGGAALYATEVSPVPTVNAGSGINQHPLQTPLDLYTIRFTQSTLRGLYIVVVGDPRFGRTIHPLIEGMHFSSPRFTFVAPPELRPPGGYRWYCDEHHLRYEETSFFIPEMVADADIFYMIRVQRERFTGMEEYECTEDVYILNKEMLQGTKDNLHILHSLPRVNETDIDVDSSPKAEYFCQAQSRLYIRQSILCEVLGIKVDK